MEGDREREINIINLSNRIQLYYKTYSTLVHHIFNITINL